jgi:hypothetical protein
MYRGFLVICFGLGALTLASVASRAADPAAGQNDAPRYTADGKLIFPNNYREWVYLSSGLGMTYSPPGMAGGDPTFTNVFVKPEAYRTFVQTGHWPDKVVFVLEVRDSTSHGSILKGGRYQTGVLGYDVEVRDDERFPEHWRFFGFGGTTGTIAPGTGIPKTAACFQCHSKNAAVENTFVQFYPTLLEVAKQKGTLNASYLSAEASATAAPTATP